MTEDELREEAKHRFMVPARQAVKILDAKDAEIERYVNQLAELLNEYADTLGEMCVLRQALGLDPRGHLDFEGHVR